MRGVGPAETFRNLTRLILVLAASAIPATIQFFIYPREAFGPVTNGEGPTLTAQSARRLMKPILWVDARTEAEYQRGHIEGAVWFYNHDIDTGVDQLLEKWNPGDILIVYCSSIRCDSSTELAVRLRKAGFPEVYVLEGGWKEWSKNEI